jgi:hypothetical protein
MERSQRRGRFSPDEIKQNTIVQAGCDWGDSAKALVQAVSARSTGALEQSKRLRTNPSRSGQGRDRIADLSAFQAEARLPVNHVMVDDHAVQQALS